jgi:hypothetical protein
MAKWGERSHLPPGRCLDVNPVESAILIVFRGDLLLGDGIKYATGKNLNHNLKDGYLSEIIFGVVIIIL